MNVGTPIHAVVLAAGTAKRMGGPNKLLACFDGMPLVRRVALRAIASRAAGTVVVTGHDAASLQEALAGLPVRIVHNPDFRSGMASSLRTGIAALPEDARAAMVLLADMPAIETEHLERLIAAWEEAGQGCVIRALSDGLAGHPVILPRALFPRIAGLEGDTGARRLIESGRVPSVGVELGSPAAMDVDTPEALVAAGGTFRENMPPPQTS